MNFTETIQWVGVVQPVNTDFNVAEKTTLNFLEPHGLIVGDYVEETLSGAKGIVYEVPSATTLNLAKQDATPFPESGIIVSGIIEITYVSRTISHGINNQVIQDLVDRTAYNKKRIDDLEIQVDNNTQNVTILLESQIGLNHEVVTESVIAGKNKRYVALNTSNSTITVSLPTVVSNGDWVSVMKGGTIPVVGITAVYTGPKKFNSIYGPNFTVDIDIPFKFITFTYYNDSWIVTN